VSESQIFADALKTATPAERAAFLDGACAGNPQLRADLVWAAFHTDARMRVFGSHQKPHTEE
jgi:hypothetical protein